VGVSDASEGSVIPGTYNLPLTENSTNALTFAIAGITTAVGYAAAIDLRKGDTLASDLVLALTSPLGGIVLSSDGISLIVTVTIAETQIDALAAALALGGVFWSLKVTAPGGATTQYLKGAVAFTRTPTA
jgi:hypothetical protein